MKYLLSFLPYSIFGLAVGVVLALILSIPIWKAVVLILVVIASMIFLNFMVLRYTLAAYDAKRKQVHAEV